MELSILVFRVGVIDSKANKEGGVKISTLFLQRQKECYELPPPSTG